MSTEHNGREREEHDQKKVLLTSTTFFQSFRSENFWALQNKHKIEAFACRIIEVQQIITIIVMTLLSLGHNL